jgi:hypothetical protein
VRPVVAVLGVLFPASSGFVGVENLLRSRRAELRRLAEVKDVVLLFMMLWRKGLGEGAMLLLSIGATSACWRCRLRRSPRARRVSLGLWLSDERDAIPSSSDSDVASFVLVERSVEAMAVGGGLAAEPSLWARPLLWCGEVSSCDGDGGVGLIFCGSPELTRQSG